jgi:hypothetical protein
MFRHLLRGASDVIPGEVDRGEGQTESDRPDAALKEAARVAAMKRVSVAKFAARNRAGKGRRG